jgi:NADH/NAD ratio-sensing transcriptional regulator Rex
MIHDLKTNIAKRIVKKSPLIKEVLKGEKEHISSKEYILILNIKKGIEALHIGKDLSQFELAGELRYEYERHLIYTWGENDLLEYLLDIEREDALTEHKENSSKLKEEDLFDLFAFW